MSLATNANPSRLGVGPMTAPRGDGLAIVGRARSCRLRSVLVLCATALTLPASAESLVGLPTPVEWATGPGDSTFAPAPAAEGPRIALRDGALALSTQAVARPVHGQAIRSTSAPAVKAQVAKAEGEGGLVVDRPRQAGAEAVGALPAFEVRPVDPARGNCGPGSDFSVSDVRALIARVATEEGTDARLADAVADQESRYDQRRISPKGAIGVMQLMPETARRYQVDPCELEPNIRGGVRYLRDLSAEFGGNVMLVLAAYNAGADRVYAAKGVPPIAETVRYVAAVTNVYYGFENALSSAKAGRQPTPGAEPQAKKRQPAEGSGVVTVADSGDRWIGGSVLYVDQSQGGSQ
jgi:soluble lytic murein transglycosylase-like protein